jgi:hypothetical protein
MVEVQGQSALIPARETHSGPALFETYTLPFRSVLIASFPWEQTPVGEAQNQLNSPRRNSKEHEQPCFGEFAEFSIYVYRHLKEPSTGELTGSRDLCPDLVSFGE